jgi:hypothetical protein
MTCQGGSNFIVHAQDHEPLHYQKQRAGGGRGGSRGSKKDWNSYSRP